MHDFLTRLTERTLGLVPVAQPIISPMFAPNNLNDNTQDLVQRNGSQGTLDKTQARPAQELGEASFPEMKGNIDNDIFKPISKSVNFRGSKDITQVSPTQEDQINFSNSYLMGEARYPEKSKHSKENISDRNEPNEPPKDAVISENNQGNIREPEYALNAQKDVSEHRIVLDELSTNTMWRDGPAVPEAQHAETFTPYTQRRSLFQNGAPPKSSSSTPTIQVTIGRIEVRAITPPAAPAQRLRTRSPTLSLDDYLKQRNGGKR